MTFPAAIEKRGTFWLSAALMIVVGALYAGTWRCGFVNIDDNRYVTENARVRGGLSWENFKWAFGVENPSGIWIPLTWISLQLDASLSGKDSPGIIPKKPVSQGAPPPFPDATVYHIHNVLLEMIAVVVLFLFLWRSTKLRWAAFGAALFWAIHPLRVESVAWVTERKDVLAAVYGFLAMYVFVMWVETKKWWWYAAASVAFAMSLMAKPMFVTLPFVLVLWDAWPLRRVHTWRELAVRIGEKWGMLLLAAAASIWTMVVQRALVETPDSRGVGERLAGAVVGYGDYFIRQVRVWDLGVYYPNHGPPEVWRVVLYAGVLLVITGICVRAYRRSPWLLVGWLWFLGTLLPMIGLVKAGNQSYADRYSYLPSVGIWIMAAYTVQAVVTWRPRVERLAWVIGVGTAVVLVGFTLRQVRYWKDTATLGARTLEVTKDNWFVHEMMAIDYLREGENELAEEHFKRTVEIAPEYQQGWLLLGAFHLQSGHVEESLGELGKAAKLNPRDGKAHYYHGVALERAGHKDAAILEYWNTSQLEPNNRAAANALSKAMEDRAALESAAKYVPQLLERK